MPAGEARFPLPMAVTPLARRSRRRCQQCRSSRKKCVPLGRENKCQLCEKFGKPCGPMRTAKEERRALEVKDESVPPKPAKGSISCILLEDDESSCASDEDVEIINAREVQRVDMFSRNMHGIDRCFQKLGLLLACHKALTCGREIHSAPMTPSSVSQMYALNDVVRELEWTTQELIRLSDSALYKKDKGLVDRILLRILEVVQSIAELTVQVKCTALEKVVQFYSELCDEERVQKALQILLTLVGSPGSGLKIRPHSLLAHSMLRTSRVLHHSFITSRIPTVPGPIRSPALHQSITCESPQVFYATLKIIRGRSTPGTSSLDYGCKGTTPSCFSFDHNEDIETRDTFGRTPLHYAAGLGKVDYCYALLQEGARADQRDFASHTILSTAARNGFTVIINELLFKGAEADPQTLQQEPTPLEEAAAGGHADIVALLLDKGAGRRNSHLFRALERARENGCESVVQQISGWLSKIACQESPSQLENDFTPKYYSDDPTYLDWICSGPVENDGFHSAPHDWLEVDTLWATGQ